jgi:YD repeat-containing protein
VVEQRYGTGVTTLSYQDAGDGLRTTVRAATGGVVVLRHDERGHLVERAVEVSRAAFLAADLPAGAGVTVPIVTTFRLNRHSEVVQRTEPAGGRTRWDFTADDPDPRNRGNLVRVVRTPDPGVPADQAELVTAFEVEGRFQRPVAVTDPGGRTTRYAYDERGNRTAVRYPAVSVQPVGAGDRPPAVTGTFAETVTVDAAGRPVRATHADGTATAYAYHPDEAGGQVAAVTEDADGAALTTGYEYDAGGRQRRVVDPSGDAAELDRNAAGQLTGVRGRAAGSVLRHSYDEAGNVAATHASGVTERLKYDDLGRVVARTLEGGELSTTERFERDRDGRVTRHVRPEGGVTEYVHDERDLLIALTRGAGTPDASTERFAWTVDGALRGHTDGRGHTTVWTYDGFGRCSGVADPAGTTWTRRIGPAGETEAVTVRGPDGDEGTPAAETAYRRDEWGRTVRTDRVWRDAAGRPLGRSGWDDAEGVAAVLVEYGPDGRTAAVWSEGDAVTRLTRDGAGRVTGERAPTGDECLREHDAAGNVVGLHCPGAGPTVRAGYDAMDRLTLLATGDRPASTFGYDGSGAPDVHGYGTGLVVRQVRDDLGRRTELRTTVPDGDDEHLIVRRFAYDRDFRLVSEADAAGHRTGYGYDALGRQVSVRRADGAEVRVAYDAAGNPVRTVDENDTVTENSFDAVGRLTERRTGAAEAERFGYDGLGRLVTATSAAGTVRWTYDSLSRPLTEEFAGRVVRATYDAAGNPVTLAYPGGEVLHRRYDPAGRVIAVDTAAGEPVARVTYQFGSQVARLELAGWLVAEHGYDADRRLTSVTYRRADDGALVQSFHYGYDGAGLMTEAIRRTAAGVSAERYRYDAAGRPRLARYDIADPADPQSPFGLETAYEPLPEGLWARRTDRDGAGAVLADQVGEVDDRNRYRRFGDLAFETDASGDVVRRTGPDGACRHTYDGEHRLIRLECLDAAGRRRLTVTYGYDALGRLVTRSVTDADGVTTGYAYVWAGDVLLEEYENGVLARTYLHSVGTLPAVLLSAGLPAGHLYVHDGRGLVSGLVRRDDPSTFAEKYGYEVTGAGFVTEIAGVPVALPDRRQTSSALLNAVLSGMPGVLHDWRTGLLAGLGGRQLDPRIAGVLNGVSRLAGKSHAGVRDTLQTQLAGLLGMTGSGGTVRPPQPRRGFRPELGALPGDAPLRGPSLIPSAREPRNPAFDLSGSAGGQPDGSSSPSDDLGGLNSSFGVPGAFETTPLALIGGALGTVIKGLLGVDPARASPKPDNGGANQAELNALAEAAEAQRQQAEKDRAAWEAAARLEAENEERRRQEEAKKQEQQKDDEDEDEAGLTKPVADPVILRSARQVEAVLNGTRHPADPGGGGEGTSVDLASPPRQQGGIDPTIALFPADAPAGGWAGGSTPAKLLSAPIDYGRDREPPQLGPPSPGVGSPYERRP